jgi:FkbM family methyltransferase
MKNLIKKLLLQYDRTITRHSYVEALKEYERSMDDLFAIKPDDLLRLDDLKKVSQSQIKQDLFVLLTTNFMQGGYFVDFGATNGYELSNTYLLEKQFGWKGILAEPAKIWHAELKRNRTAHIETDCVWKKSGEILQFNEVKAAELSTISQFTSNGDSAKESRKDCISYPVTTISLIDLLEKFNAPKIIDYLSIDTEGSEFEILNSFDFNKYSIKIITCEHNYTPKRNKIYDLLTQQGYARKFVGFSRWDDWYVKLD